MPSPQLVEWHRQAFTNACATLQSPQDVLQTASERLQRLVAALKQFRRERRATVRHLWLLESKQAPHDVAVLAVAWNDDFAVGAAAEDCRKRIQPKTVLLYVGAMAWVATRGKNRPNLSGEDDGSAGCYLTCSRGAALTRSLRPC